MLQVLDLNKKDVEEAFEIFSNMNPPLKTRLWRLMAIRLSTGLFMDLPAFQVSDLRTPFREVFVCGIRVQCLFTPYVYRVYV